MRTLCILLSGILFVSSTEAAVRPRALRRVITVGTVWINAAALPSGSAIYDGDTIATAANGFALITSPGEQPLPGAPASARADRVEVRRDSLVSVGAEDVTLKSGVVGSDGFAVRVGGDVVRPAQGGQKNWFVVADREGQKLVAAYEGNLLIARADGEPIIVPAGSYAVPEKPPAEDKDGEFSGKIPAASQKSGWMIFSLTGAGAVLIVTLGATAAFATMLGLAIADNPVSPAQ